jgi:hypothetical protein
MKIPPEVREEVLAELARQFDTARWEEVSGAAASEMYDRFVKHPDIGGRLRPFMPDAKIRVWIKDGPAKEYRRALEGVGPIARYTSRSYPGPDAIVKSALGSNWFARAETVEEKPMRCFAEGGDEKSSFVIWGPLSALQGLVWNSCLLRAYDPRQSITIVITKPNSTPILGDEWGLVERLAKIVNADCRQVTYAVGRKSPLPS